MGTSFHGSLAVKPGRGLICQGLVCGRRFWDGCLSVCGTCGGGLSAGNCERRMKGPLGMGHLSLERLTVEGLEGGLLYWVPWVTKGRLWGRASLFMVLRWATWSGLIYLGL